MRPVSLAWCTAFLVAVAVAVAAFMVLGQYTRKARVSGYLVPDRGLIRLLATQPATVVERHVDEGATVQRGDTLFVLDVGQATLTGDTQSAVQASLEAREQSLHGAVQQQQSLQRSQTAAVDLQVVQLRHELATVDAESALQVQRLGLLQESLSRFESLREQNFVSAAQVQGKTEEVLALKAQQQSLERQRAGLVRQIAVLQAQRDEVPLRGEVERGALLRDIQSLAQQSAENEARRRIVVRAPQDGTVTAVTAEPGQSVAPGVALASLVPAGTRLEAQLFAPSSAIGFVRAHQPVLLRYQAFPYQKFGHQTGEVAQISRSPLQAAELAALPLPIGNGEPLYRITVALDRQSVAAYGQAQPLSPGMQLDADVVLDRRRLVEWIFEPVLGIAGRL